MKILDAKMREQKLTEISSIGTAPHAETIKKERSIAK